MRVCVCVCVVVVVVLVRIRKYNVRQILVKNYTQFLITIECLFVIFCYFAQNVIFVCTWCGCCWFCIFECVRVCVCVFFGSSTICVSIFLVVISNIFCVFLLVGFSL